MATASSPKASAMVFSRPMWSETHPQIGRQIPLITRSRLSANGKASTVQPRMVTGALSTLKSLAIGASWAVAIKPPVATMVIMKYMSQKWDVEAISAEVKETGAWRVLTSSLPLDLQVWGSQPAGGDLRNDAAMTTTTPWMMPQRMKVAWYPAEVIMLAMGATVNADPAPKPAAVNPAASPRWSGNHLSALPMAVPYTMPAPSPATA